MLQGEQELLKQTSPFPLYSYIWLSPIFSIHMHQCLKIYHLVHSQRISLWFPFGISQQQLKQHSDYRFIQINPYVPAGILHPSGQPPSLVPGKVINLELCTVQQHTVSHPVRKTSASESFWETAKGALSVNGHLSKSSHNVKGKKISHKLHTQLLISLYE